MVTISGVKYACDRCIRGHRVSGCSHLDKPLTMIKKKGRPSTHCMSCRKGRSGKPFTCSCMDPRREKVIIMPHELQTLIKEHERVELPDGTLITPSLLVSSNGQRLRSPESRTQSNSPAKDSSSSSSSTAVDWDEQKRMEPIIDADDDFEGGSGKLGHNEFDASAPSSPQYRNRDGYLDIPAFRYQAGLYGQTYDADLYTSARGNNLAAAEANAAGQLDSRMFKRSPVDHHEMFLNRASSHASAVDGRALQLGGLSAHSLLSTTPQELEASKSALSPLAGSDLDIGREELVNGILRTPVAGRPDPRSRGDQGRREEKNGDSYSQAQSMPKLSSLY